MYALRVTLIVGLYRWTLKDFDGNDAGKWGLGELDRAVRKLMCRLPIPPTAREDRYRVPPGLLEAIRANPSDLPSLQRLADDMLAFLGIDKLGQSVTVRVTDGDADGRARASYAGICGGETATIYLHRQDRETDSWNRLLSRCGFTLWTVAHEITHHYLAFFHVRETDPQANERLTDVAAVFLGFGWVYIDESFDSFRLSSLEDHVPLGYLTFEELFFVAARSAKRRQIVSLAQGVPNELRTAFARYSQARRHQGGKAADEARLDDLVDGAWQARKQLRWLQACVKEPTTGFRAEHSTDWRKLADVANAVAVFGDELDQRLASILQHADSPQDGSANPIACVDELERQSAAAAAEVARWFEVVCGFVAPP